MPRYWLMKSEPSEVSIDDLEAAPGQVLPWTGVRNYQARNFMRDDMRIGDGVLFYHSSCAEPGVAGLARIAGGPCPDGGETLLGSAVAAVDREMSAIRDGGKVKARERIAVLAALNLAYQLADRPLAAPSARSADASHSEVNVEALIRKLDAAIGDDGHLL